MGLLPWNVVDVMCCVIQPNTSRKFVRSGNLAQLTDEVPTRCQECQVVVVKVAVRRKQGKSASGDFDGLFTATLKRKSEVCGVRVGSLRQCPISVRSVALQLSIRKIIKNKIPSFRNKSP